MAVLILAVVACCCLAAMPAAAQQTVDFPTYKNHALYIEVYRVKNEKKQTVLETTVYNEPGYWIQMNSGDVLVGCTTGKTYRQLRAEGFEMDRQVAMPDSGCRSFSLFFEPIDPRDRRVHWLENGRDTLFSELGVRPETRRKGKIACRIRGTVEGDRPCVRLLVNDVNQDPRSQEPLSIPVRGNCFDYTLYTDVPEIKSIAEWEEIREGAWVAHVLFVENGENVVRLPEGRKAWEFLKGTEANQEWVRCEEERRQRFKDAGGDELYRQIKQMGDSATYSPAGLALYRELRKLYEEAGENGMDEEMTQRRNAIFERQRQMASDSTFFSAAYYDIMRRMSGIEDGVDHVMRMRMNERHSVAGLYFLYKLVNKKIENKRGDILQEYKDYCETYASQWGEHPIGKAIEGKAAAALSMKPGNPYIDYQAEDFDGKPVAVKEWVKGKWALIDLWASWCGACRANSRKLIPLYHKYKDRNFIIVGIARETKITDALGALKKEKFPWPQLVELNNKNSIWLRHGMEWSVGGTFLIRPDGKIAAVNPTVEEIEGILQDDKEKLDPQ